MEKKLIFPTLLAAFIFSACTKIQEPEFRRIDGFRIKGLTLTEATIGFNITYYNPNNFTMTVKETQADVSLERVGIGKFVQDTLIRVGARSEFSIPISGAIPFQKALQFGLQNSSGNDILIKATGTTKVGKAGLYITKPFNYEGRHRINQMQ